MLSFYMFYDNDSDELVLKTYSTKRKDVKHVNMKMFFPASYIKHMKELVNFVNMSLKKDMLVKILNYKIMKGKKLKIWLVNHAQMQERWLIHGHMTINN